MVHRARPRLPASSSVSENKHSDDHLPRAPQARLGRRWRYWLLGAFIVLLLLVSFLLVPRWAFHEAIAMEQSYLDIDYVGLVSRPTCINKFVLKNLLRHQRPRRIFLIVPDLEACQEHLGSISLIVKCIQEDSLFPDITKASVTAALESYYPQLRGDQYVKGRTLSGWYLQQLLKLAVSQAIPDLSGVYVIWDMDMIPTRHIPLVYLPGPDISSQGAGHSWQLPVDVNVMSVHGQPARTVVNIGGAWSPGYGESYEKLFQKRPSFAEDGTSFVSHWIVVQKHLMQRFLDALCPPEPPEPGAAPSGCKWHDAILRNLPPDDLSHGFSEYHSYVSFVKQNWPQTQHDMRKKTWMRQTIGGGLGVKLARMGSKGGLCCPTAWQHSVQGAAGYEYYGLEAGHHPECRWNDPKFQRYYGPA